MMRAVIIDDEHNSLRSLELLILQFVPELKVVATASDPLIGISLINDYRPDVVFLDINMPNINGFELLEKLDYRSFHLVFTTAHSEYGIRAIKQGATDYLLKPVDLEELEIVVGKIKQSIQKSQALPDMLSALNQIREPQEAKVVIPVKNGFEYMSPKEIVYIEASSSRSLVHCANGNRMMAYKALKDYELLLCRGNASFIRINNSFIVNLNYVTRYMKEDGGYVVLQDKKTIPVSKFKKDQFLRLINFFPQ